MSKPSRQTLVLANATRLLNDARLLVEHRRFASAFALAVLAVEEIRKALLDGWDTERPLAKPKTYQSQHIRKQMAVASLLLGTFIVRTYPGDSLAANLEGDRLTSLTKKFNESPAGQFFLYTHDRELEKRKQNALYQDDWLTAVADDFAEEHVNDIFKIADDARDDLNDDLIRRYGRALYELMFCAHPNVRKSEWAGAAARMKRKATTTVRSKITMRRSGSARRIIRFIFSYAAVRTIRQSDSMQTARRNMHVATDAFVFSCTKANTNPRSMITMMRSGSIQKMRVSSSAAPRWAAAGSRWVRLARWAGGFAPTRRGDQQ
jgi:AbiV family abortive infection protein